MNEKKYLDAKTELRLFLVGEVGRYINRAGSTEKLSLLLGRSLTYVRVILDREPTLERLELLWKECKEKIK